MTISYLFTKYFKEINWLKKWALYDTKDPELLAESIAIHKFLLFTEERYISLQNNYRKLAV